MANSQVKFNRQPKNYSNFKLDPVKASSNNNGGYGGYYNPNMQQYANNAAIDSSDINNVVSIAEAGRKNPLGLLASAIGYRAGSDYQTRGEMNADKDSQGFLEDFIKSKAQVQQPTITKSINAGTDAVNGNVQAPIVMEQPSTKQMINQNSDYFAKLQVDPNARGNENKNRQDLTEVDKGLAQVDITQYSDSEILDYINQRLATEKGRTPRQIANIQNGILARIADRKQAVRDKKITDLISVANQNLNDPEKLTEVASQLSRLGSSEASLYAARANGLFNELTARRNARQALMDKIAYAQWAQANGLKGYGTVGAGNPSGGTTNTEPQLSMYATRFENPLNADQTAVAKAAIARMDEFNTDIRRETDGQRMTIDDLTPTERKLVLAYNDSVNSPNRKIDIVNDPYRAQNDVLEYMSTHNLAETRDWFYRQGYHRAPWGPYFAQKYGINYGYTGDSE